MDSYNIRRNVATLAVALATLPSCTGTTPTTPVDVPVVSAATIRSSNGNATVYWNEAARGMVASTGAATPFAIRGYAVLSVAQYEAAVAAERGKDRGVPPSPHAAVSAASVVVLSYLFPDHATQLEAALAAYLDEARSPGASGGDVAAGVAIGRDAGEQLVVRATNDGFFAPWNGTIPTGPGVWFSMANPPSAGGAAFGGARPFLLVSNDQFRPAPPPAFGTSAFDAALAEVRQYSETRTPAQDSIAKFWHLPAGTYAPPGYWNEEATTLATRFRMGEREAAHVLALTNMVMYDALIASHEAKYTYWLLRPSQADPAITLSVGLPNFPTYPSNHAAISAGAAKVIGRAFPSERRRLEGRAEEAALSRVFGGIHYRFDGEAGLALGRAVADWAIMHDVKGHRSFALR